MPGRAGGAGVDGTHRDLGARRRGAAQQRCRRLRRPGGAGERRRPGGRGDRGVIGVRIIDDAVADVRRQGGIAHERGAIPARQRIALAIGQAAGERREAGGFLRTGAEHEQSAIGAQGERERRRGAGERPGC